MRPRLKLCCFSLDREPMEFSTTARTAEESGDAAHAGYRPGEVLIGDFRRIAPGRYVGWVLDPARGKRCAAALDRTRSDWLLSIRVLAGLLRRHHRLRPCARASLSPAEQPER